MATKYVVYTIDTDDPTEAIAQVQHHGVIVRTHTEGGKTRVYVAAEHVTTPRSHRAQEVEEAEVLKIV